MSWKTFKSLGFIYKVMYCRILLVQCLKFCIRLNVPVCITIHGTVYCDTDLLWYHLGNVINHRIWKIHNAAYILDNRPCCHCSKCNYLAYAFFTIFLYNIVNNPLPALRSKVHINIRHGYSLRV